ncbi:RsmB/NOP family class I SAM-dependent RNA methyltransferase [Mesobaculum littorinae]|uniref:RsmB/NOP family class I SAM-dependent RNA methyltransferase n=1 Tax=Mesobaculum littorinae TaxID=2486419 RepID=A0A438ALV4_9RHOB|nr:RsmB/NOP family class I SAM-dependent RNA methyltransferase [Mesobaculum littorinae]RVV99624.1 RsmB/NOP family class I SAM-dependent RNA methyltransferase [Mesobaculum littorinae]
MTPGARIAAAIEILDAWLAGEPAEKVLTTWGRRNRFAGSKDRAAIRDHVFDAIRCKRSFAALGGAMTGRGLMLGALRAQGTDPSTLFTGTGYAPEPPLDTETGHEPARGSAEALDCPDWLFDDLSRSLGADFAAVMETLRSRAPVFLRVNTRKSDVHTAMRRLADEGVDTRSGPLSSTAVEVVSGARRIAASRAYADGLIELQDAASQALADRLAIAPGARVLDYCAGGGGKSLSMAARVDADFTAHDISPARMRDLPERARRAGVEIAVTTALAEEDRFDVVLVDAPCSGSGAWRRSPAGKWSLNSDGLQGVMQAQDEVLRQASRHVASGGVLAYATCSLLDLENGQRIKDFLAEAQGWTTEDAGSWTPLDGGDGFYLCILRREG